MNLIDMLIYFVIGIAVLGIIIGYTSGKFNKANKMEEDLINKTLEDPFSITGDSVKESDLSLINARINKEVSSPYFPINKHINKFSVL